MNGCSISYYAALDFEDVSAVIEFPAGSQAAAPGQPPTQACATFTINDDSIVENQETFIVTATNGAFQGGQDSIQVVTDDNDGKKLQSEDKISII